MRPEAGRDAAVVALYRVGRPHVLSAGTGGHLIAFEPAAVRRAANTARRSSSSTNSRSRVIEEVSHYRPVAVPACAQGRLAHVLW